MIDLVPWELIGFVAPHVYHNLVAMGEIIWKE